MKHLTQRDTAETRIAGYDWTALAAELDGNGAAVLAGLLRRCR